MNIMGLSSICDGTSAALVSDGRLVALVEQERLNRKKNTWEHPYDAAVECVRISGIRFSDIDAMVFYSKPWMEMLGNAGYFLRHLPKTLNLLKVPTGSDDLSFFPRFKRVMHFADDFKPLHAGKRIPTAFVEHHMAHAANCFLCSPYEEAAVFTCDGRGEYSTAVFWHGRGTSIRPVHRIPLPHSLGFLYGAVTSYLGFRPFKDEGKVMGLAAFGDDRFLEPFAKLATFKDGVFTLDLDYFLFQYYSRARWYSPKMEELFGPARHYPEPLTDAHRAVARALQEHTERLGVEMARWFRKESGLKKLCLSGGVFLNCQMNTRILREAGFHEVFIQPVAGDPGTPYGAALHEWVRRTGRREQVFRDIYLGTGYSDSDYEAALSRAGLEYRRSPDVASEAAVHLDEGRIVGWFQGRMEAGPRALGNRSILADPRRGDMKDRLNKRIKGREPFRPFAPSVQWEHTSEYFDTPAESPYMILTAGTKPGMAQKIPAVIHVDDTARLQTVRKEDNPRYWGVIEAFRKRTGVPMVLNTSFNENEPIVRSPSEAVDCFVRTGMDVLVLGDFIVEGKRS
jgi:carbamoyltransferase